MLLKGSVCHRIIILTLFLNIFSNCLVAQKITGQVLDPGGYPLPFATIKFGDTKEGVIANLEGKFSISSKLKFIEVSHTNYTTQKVEIIQERQELLITLQPSPSNLETVVITRSSGKKLKRILNSAINNRSLHNPDNYDWYQCNVYYKMIVGIDVKDTVFTIDTSKQNPEIIKPYFLLTETYSKRTWEKPVKLQEQIVASRMSGFKKPVLLSLVTDVLPFHAYDDFINLNGKDFYNPINKGLYQRFKFNLSDEIIQQGDTIWVIDFRPLKDPADLTGTVYITSDGFAITHIIAHSTDITTKKDIGIEQQYARHEGKWFPQQLNYILQWQLSKEDSIMIRAKGVSVIDSVTFEKDNNFKFDKSHTIKLLPGAEEYTDSSWIKLRPIPLDARENRTYVFMDSVVKKAKVEKLVGYVTKLMDGKFPAGKFDINISRLYSFNTFENNRLGWGMQTNDKLSKIFSIGGWAGYGTRDKQWKYGAFAELYTDKYKEFIINASWYRDLRDPGRLRLNKEVDNSTLRMFLISRPDRVEGWNVSVKKKLGYVSLEMVAGREEIQPQYDYSFKNGSKIYRSFSINEASLNIRYSFGEISSPFLGKYYSSSSKYPVLYGRILTGKILNANIHYNQIIGAVSWTKNINRLGKENFLLSGGITLGTRVLPLSKLFAGNGFFAGGISVHAFGAMETMLPYQFFSDRFINFYWLHVFNSSLFRLKVSKELSICPKPALAYNVLYGTLENPNVHHKVLFSVPDKVYHEAGLLINNIFRFRILGLYATFNAGYFHTIFNRNIYTDRGSIVYGIGAEF